MSPIFVKGFGLWSLGFCDVMAWLTQNRDSTVLKPEARLLKGALKRRSSNVTRMAVEAYSQAANDAGCSPKTAHSVWATAHGEHETALRLFETMHEGEGKVSPTNFHNSVHNSPSGYASISAKNTAPSTTLTGGSELVAAALIEASCMARSFNNDTILVFADEALKPPFDLPGSEQPLAVALCLGTESNGSHAKISGIRRDSAPLQPVEGFGHLHISAILPLVEQILKKRSGRVSLEFGENEEVWGVDVDIENS